MSILGRLTTVVLLALLALVCGWAPMPVPGPAAAAPTPSDWAVFAGKGCARCHRLRGFGEGAAGSDLAHVRSGPGFFVIAAALWNHVPDMRGPMRERGGEWPQFTPQDMSNLISFVFTAQDRDGSGRAGVGASLFASRGCAQCHVAGARGQPLGPLLDELKGSTSPVLLTAAMWNHGSQMTEAMKAAGVARVTLSGTELSDIVAYIQMKGGDGQGRPAPALFGLAERGKGLFADKGCGACHVVADHRSAGPSFRSRAPRGSITELAARMWNHGRAVGRDGTTPRTSLSRLTGQETADLVAYLHASYYFDSAEGDGRRGRRLLQDKRCLQCHSVYNKGGGLAPDLARSNVVSTQTGQLTAMWNHGRFMENKALRQAIVLPTLTPQELSDITRYLAALGSVVPTPR
jgi:mono/diheme cytochrome c family protein